jgi:hypothetical protein
MSGRYKWQSGERKSHRIIKHRWWWAFQSRYNFPAKKIKIKIQAP